MFEKNYGSEDEETIFRDLKDEGNRKSDPIYVSP